VTPPARRVVCGDARAWMNANAAAAGTSVVTSLPDLSELPHLELEGWRAWFVGAARHVLGWIPDDGGAVFFQSDVLHRGAWIDKGYLVARAADEAGAVPLWHAVVCRDPPGTATNGRATYAHMLCFARRPLATGRVPRVDVLPDGGEKPWSRAMGATACRAACTFLRDALGTRRIVDPFCGHGTALAAANELGLDSIGVDLVERRCRAARRLVLG